MSDKLNTYLYLINGLMVESAWINEESGNKWVVMTFAEAGIILADPPRVHYNVKNNLVRMEIIN
jgi:hypothetical protein